jgi:hypothetical protein
MTCKQATLGGHWGVQKRPVRRNNIMPRIMLALEGHPFRLLSCITSASPGWPAFSCVVVHARMLRIPHTPRRCRCSLTPPPSLAHSSLGSQELVATQTRLHGFLLQSPQVTASYFSFCIDASSHELHWWLAHQQYFELLALLVISTSCLSGRVTTACLSGSNALIPGSVMTALPYCG